MNPLSERTLEILSPDSIAKHIRIERWPTLYDGDGKLKRALTNGDGACGEYTVRVFGRAADAWMVAGWEGKNPDELRWGTAHGDEGDIDGRLYVCGQTGRTLDDGTRFIEVAHGCTAPGDTARIRCDDIARRLGIDAQCFYDEGFFDKFVGLLDAALGMVCDDALDARDMQQPDEEALAAFIIANGNASDCSFNTDEDSGANASFAMQAHAMRFARVVMYAVPGHASTNPEDIEEAIASAVRAAIERLEVRLDDAVEDVTSDLAASCEQ